MEINIQAIHFEASEQLIQFINKKVSKLSKHEDKIGKVEVSLKVVKPETALNKEASLKLALPGKELYAQEVCDTFEEAIDKTMDSLGRQLTKYKEMQRKR